MNWVAIICQFEKVGPLQKSLGKTALEESETVLQIKVRSAIWAYWTWDSHYRLTFQCLKAFSVAFFSCLSSVVAYSTKTRQNIKRLLRILMLSDTVTHHQSQRHHVLYCSTHARRAALIWLLGFVWTLTSAWHNWTCLKPFHVHSSHIWGLFIQRYMLHLSLLMT